MPDVNSSITLLEASLAKPIGASFNIDEVPDVIAQLLADKRSPNTRKAYMKDITDFFDVVAKREPSRDLVLEFLHLEQSQAVQLVLSYKAKLFEKGLKEATVNRRLAAIKSLTAMGRKIGVCNYTLEDVKGEKTKAYRDTTGVSKETFTKVLLIPDALKEAVYSQRSRLKAVRDYALLRLLWGNALRRGEISLTNINDFDPENNTLSILGKGRGTEREVVSLSPKTVCAIEQWLEVRGTADRLAPLFIAIDNASYGHRLSGNGIYSVVDKLCKKAGVSKKMSPHRIRHSSITAALDATDGNIRKVQKLSRHANINTLMTYDDNRTNHQEEVTNILDDLV
ncbi:tyrosine-type recombinase/integrase [Waterburya agarophytonicola K14]|uniref:Tyrosine-type recombinase/integrase n=1 Tax=Waterburya agarophytonicola KI4 TaxID=2874699 RepID=A0A964BVG9_9CYAN|nr:tyrosine-type recombinase/integrase [Waterburya agarophytonicola]MCC0179451.1 tyrosine-type recombinase/integrase [Waterburya agarophytonicola KI4]